MRIAYLTTDEVNLDLARQLAKAQHITLCHLTPREATPGDLFDAVILDWDYWPVESRAETLAALVDGGANRPVALHSYNLDKAQAEAFPCPCLELNSAASDRQGPVERIAQEQRYQNLL